MESTLKKGFLISLLVFTSQVYSIQGTNSSWFACSDLLVWQMREEGANNWAQTIELPGTAQAVQILDVPFKWSPGFRICIGYNSTCDFWDTLFSYTWYKAHGLNSAHETSGFVYSSFLGNFFIDNTDGAKISVPDYRDAGMRWDLLFNTFDLELGRTFRVDESLQIRPFLGLKGSFIDQDINTSWHTPFGRDNALEPLTPITTFSSAVENIKNDFGGLGPSVGLNTSWSLHETSNGSFKLIGNFSGAFVFGRWNIKDTYENDAPESVAIINDKIKSALTMVRGIMGIEWNRCLSRTTLTIRLSYESQVWFNQLRFYSFNMGRLNTLLSLHGGVLDFCINF